MCTCVPASRTTGVTPAAGAAAPHSLAVAAFAVASAMALSLAVAIAVSAAAEPPLDSLHWLQLLDTSEVVGIQLVAAPAVATLWQHSPLAVACSAGNCPHSPRV